MDIQCDEKLAKNGPGSAKDPIGYLKGMVIGAATITDDMQVVNPESGAADTAGAILTSFDWKNLGYIEPMAFDGIAKQAVRTAINNVLSDQSRVYKFSAQLHIYVHDDDADAYYAAFAGTATGTIYAPNGQLKCNNGAKYTAFGIQDALYSFGITGAPNPKSPVTITYADGKLSNLVRPWGAKTA